MREFLEQSHKKVLKLLVESPNDNELDSETAISKRSGVKNISRTIGWLDEKQMVKVSTQEGTKALHVCPTGKGVAYGIVECEADSLRWFSEDNKALSPNEKSLVNLLTHLAPKSKSRLYSVALKTQVDNDRFEILDSLDALHAIINIAFDRDHDNAEYKVLKAYLSKTRGRQIDREYRRQRRAIIKGLPPHIDNL